MNIDQRWFLLLAIVAGAAVGAAAAAKSRRRHPRVTHDPEHTTELKSWENEGGNVAPIPAAAVLT